MVPSMDDPDQDRAQYDSCMLVSAFFFSVRGKATCQRRLARKSHFQTPTRYVSPVAAAAADQATPTTAGSRSES